MRAILVLVSLLFACAKHEAGDIIGHTNAAIVITRDIEYKELAGVDPNLLSLDIYAPAQAKSLPVLIFVHGGGWRMGDKSHQMQRKPSFFTGLGYIFVSVNYRLSPAIQHPEHARDVASSIAWVHQNIASYGGDAEQLFLMGHSAGAHLVSLVATDETYLQREGGSLRSLRGVIALDGAGYDIPAQMENTKEKAANRIYQQAFGEDPALWINASPYHHLAPSKGTPPFFLVHAGEREASKQQAKKLAGLSRVGVRATIFHAPYKDHAAVNQDVGAPNDAMSDAIVTFLREHGE